MRPDNTAALIAAARSRRELTRAKAIRALRELDQQGIPITFELVATTAGVSRSWLYGQPDIREQIQRLRDATRRAPSPRIPAGQRASGASILARLESALQRNRELAEENQRLRRQLAHALGEQRTPTHRDPGSPPPETAPPRRSSVTIGSC
jgi:hypothetical protein